MNSFSSQVDFFSAFEPTPASHLRRAGQLCFDDPLSAAVALRAFAECFVSTCFACDEHSLYKKIEYIRQDVSDEVYAKLHKLRKIGNRGAHPDQFPQGIRDVQRAIRLAWEVFAWFLNQKRGQQINAEEYTPPGVLESNIIFKQAMLGGDRGEAIPEAVFYVAMAMLNQDDRICQEITSQPGSSTTFYSKRAQALDMLRSIHHKEPRALLPLIDDLLKPKVKRGASSLDRPEFIPLTEEEEELLGWYIDLAAQNELPKGLFLAGWCLLEGLYGFKKNLDSAIELFERAAAYDSPDALNALFVMYYNGTGKPKDRGKALNYLKKSVKMGFPLAKLHWGLILAEEGETKQAQAFIEDARSEYLPLADYYFARFVIEGVFHSNEDPLHLLLKAHKEKEDQASIYLLEWQFKHPLQETEVGILLNVMIHLKATKKPENIDVVTKFEKRLHTRIKSALKSNKLTDERHRDFGMYLLWFNEGGQLKHHSWREFQDRWINLEDIASTLSHPQELTTTRRDSSNHA